MGSRRAATTPWGLLLSFRLWWFAGKPARRDRSLGRLLQRRSTPLGLRRQDAGRGLCYAGKRGEIGGGVIEHRIHLSQAAVLSRKAGPALLSLPDSCLYASHSEPNVISDSAAKGGVFLGVAATVLRVRNMMEILGALVVIGIVVFWCDLTGAWNNVLRPIRALVPAYSKQRTTSP
jgi:hypothetical protein